jgi:hypothetical protein
MKNYQTVATKSLKEQVAIEASDTLSFEEFLSAYYQ